jgi:F-type H+-transporting ATPase subunit b
MESTLNALGGILLNAIPTFLLIILLHFYLKTMFFKPLEKVLRERDEATAGARKRAQEALAQAEDKSRQYEHTLSGVRNEIYKEQEEQRKQWRVEQDRHVAEAAAATRRMVEDAKQQIAAEAASARQVLDGQSRDLAERITQAVLERRGL